MKLTLSAAPAKSMPKTASKALVLLAMLADGKVHRRNDLILYPSLGESIRSALQQLRGDCFSNWLINSVVIDGEKTTGLQLDSRHLSGCFIQDEAARRERRAQLKTVSHKQAVHGRCRELKALHQKNEAQQVYFRSLNAANDPSYK
jgi:hypothetical protein